MTLLVWPPTSTVVTGSATEATQLNVLAGVGTLNAKDFATQTTLAALKTSVEASMYGSLVPTAYDYIGVNTAGATSDTLTFKVGGAGGATAKTVTLNYSGADKLTLTSVAAT